MKRLVLTLLGTFLLCFMCFSLFTYLDNRNYKKNQNNLRKTIAEAVINFNKLG